MAFTGATRFKRVYIEIGNQCNLNCPFCVKSTRPKRQMNEEEFRHVVRQVAPLTQYVYFHIKGEPLMHPQLGLFLDICEENGLQVQLTTNGTLLYQMENLLLSKSALRQVNVSLHSIPYHAQSPAHPFENQRGEWEAFARMVVGFAKRAAREKRKFCVLRLWNLDGKRETDSAAYAMMKVLEDEFPKVGALPEKMRNQRSVTLERGVFLSWEEEFQWPSLKNPTVSDEGICQGARTMIGILADGTVVPCCLDANGEAPLGNIFEEPLNEIVQSEYFGRIARSFGERHVVLPLCRRCTYRQRFDKIKRPGVGEALDEEVASLSSEE